MEKTQVSLLKRVRDTSDAESWREFYGVYQPLLLSYARSKGLQESDARDVAAEVFVKLYQTMPTFELDHSKGRFRTWLWRVTMNAITDWRRGRPDEKGMKTDFDPPGESSGATDELCELEYRRRILQVAVEQLREQIQSKHPNTWACYERHVIQNRPAADVAAELGLTANNVYVHASRVQKKLRDLCLERYEQDLAGEEP